MFEYRSANRTMGPMGEPFGWDDLFRGFDRVLRELDREAPLTSFGRAEARLVEEDGRFVLSVDVPGLTDKDVRVDLNEGVLTVTAERTVEPPEGHTARRRERLPLQFSRSFVLGERVDAEMTTAEIKDGVLTVSIPKPKGAQKKSISVKAS